MPKEFVNPDGLYEPGVYTHVITVTGGKVAFISGQIAYNQKGELVGAGDFRAQATQVMKNLETAVQSVGGNVTDIVKINIYIVNYDQNVHRPILGEVRKEIFGGHAPASTLIGIQALAFKELMLEIEAIAIID
jgi:enamine deaminase RidA (YjgF/YER057c/UK114 family)